MKLIDVRTDDGSRHFASLPKAAGWEALRDHLASLDGVEVAEPVLQRGQAVRLALTYRRHDFTITADEQRFHFFVRDPQCSDVHLFQLGSHCEKLLDG